MTKAAELAKWGEVSTNGQVSGRRNIIINGAMKVAQRSTSVTGLGATAGYHTLDRFRASLADTAGRFTMSQTADGPSGFANCLKLDCTTADASIAATEQLTILQRIEGQDLQQFKKGTSDAEYFTVSFYVKANASATYVLELFDNDNSRQISKLFNVTNSWSRVVLTFPPDTTGAFNNDNGLSLTLSFQLHLGSNFTSGTLNTAAWASNTNANRAAGIDSFFSSTDNTFFLTGLQLEVGSVATPFEHRSFGEELALCQRYYLQAGGANYKSVFGAQGWYNTTTSWIGKGDIPVPMRGAPTVSYTGTPRVQNGQAGYNISSLAGSLIADNLTTMAWGAAAATSTLYRAHDMDTNDNAALVKVDAEL